MTGDYTVIYRCHPIRRSSFLCITGLVASAALAPAFAVAAPPVIESVTFSGKGCNASNVTHRLNTATCDFEMRFDELFAASANGAAGVDDSDCAVEVTVVPPPGFRLGIGGATLEGVARTKGNGAVTVDHDYSIEREDGEFARFSDLFQADASFAGTDVKGFTQSFGAAPSATEPSQIPDFWQGGCGARTRVRGNLRLEASGDPSRGDEGEVFADRTRSGGMLAWNWMLVPCEPDGGQPADDPVAALQGSWKFDYAAPNGRRVEGRMTVAGAVGRYRPAGSPWEGALSDLRSEGRDVKATWKAPGASGWVRFTPSSDGASFLGEWGYAGAAATGSWNGQKE